MLKEISFLESKIKIIKPDIIVAHSLGAYILICMTNTFFKKILLDPSLNPIDLFNTNIEICNGRYLCFKKEVSFEFVQSISKCKIISKFSKNINNNQVYIFGAKQGGYKIAKEYNKYINMSSYELLDTDHNFSDINAQNSISKQIF